jgi:hypothetical protein
MYSEAESVMMMIEVEEKIDVTTQREKSSHLYAAGLCSLWADLDHYDRLCLHNHINVLLRGLNPRFEMRRAVMCYLPSLSSLDDAIALMEQEEIRQKVMTGEVTSVVRSALVVPTIPAREDK